MQYPVSSFSSATASVIYVASSGDTSSCGTLAFPCTTLLDALTPGKSNITDGDTVFVMGMVTMSTAIQSYSGGLENITLTADDPENGIDLGNARYISLSNVNGWLITNVTIRNGRNDVNVAPSSGNGGCLDVDDSVVVLDNVRFSGCNATGDGGALHWTGDSLSSLSLKKVVIRNSSASIGGGARVHSSDELHFQADDLLVADCVSTARGGGLDIEGTTLDVTLTHLYVSKSKSYTGGGVNFVSGGGGPYAVMQSSVIEDCESDLSGGGIKNNANLMVQDSVVSRCIAGLAMFDDGGGIHSQVGEIVLINTTVEHCTSSNEGGGLFHRNEAKLYGSRILHNFAGGSGGGITTRDTGGDLDMDEGTVVAYNVARGLYGGGVFVSSANFQYANRDFTLHRNMDQNNGNQDNFYCQNGNCNGWECATCRFGKCDFDESRSEDQRCLCYAGVTSSRQGSNKCDQCAAPGMGWNRETLRCESCPSGSFAAASSWEIPICHSCPLGTYREESEGDGLPACTPCPPNTYFNASTAGASSADVCVPCPSGLSSKEGSISCDSGDASGDITNAVVAINGDLADLETSLDSRIGDLESDIASVLAAINTFTPPDAIEGGVRIGMKVYCDADYQHNSSGDGCELIPPPELTSTTATAVSLTLVALVAVAIGVVLVRTRTSQGELVQSSTSSGSSI